MDSKHIKAYEIQPWNDVQLVSRQRLVLHSHRSFLVKQKAHLEFYSGIPEFCVNSRPYLGDSKLNIYLE